MKSYKRHQIVLLTFIAAIMAAFSVGSRLVPTALAQTNLVTLNVVSARTEPRAFGGAGVIQGDSVTEYKYIINIDNTGTTTQRSPEDGCSPVDGTEYPGSCEWPSIAGVAGSSPIYTQGDQDDFSSGLTLPDGRYLISVLADGYKLDGAHFTVPLADPGIVTVYMQPQPLPTATIHAFIFEDISPTNGAPDVPAEQGLPGFVGHIFDYLGEVTTDVFGNPLCTEYELDEFGQVLLEAPDFSPTPILGTGGQCVSDANGDLIIPNLGPNRYALSAVAPDGTTWIQTTTLEGNHDWDAWIMEGSTGLDTEFIVAGEPFPAIIFGFVQSTNTLAGGTGRIQGVIAAAKGYTPGTGGLPGGEGEASLGGARIDQPIEFPWISLTDLTNGDTAVYIGQGDANGAFDITNVPDGNYMLSYWDEPQNYILALTNVTVSGGETVDLGVRTLFGWWTKYDGYVFNDLNRNGVMDWTDLDNDGCPDPGEGELGIPNYALTMRKRENSLMDRGATAVATDACGYYIMENAYPMTQWLVMEAYNDLYYTTGVTYQADNQPEPTTILGAGVDVSVLPIIGLAGRLDWGVHFYDATAPQSYGNTVLADAPNHYYRLGESSGTTAFDAIASGSDGTYGSAVTLGAPGLLTNSDNTAVEFNGTANSFVDTGVTSMSGGPFSVEAWVNANTIDTNGHRIVVKDEVGVTGAWLLWFNQGKLRFQVRNSTNTTWVIAEAPTTPPAGTTFHAVGVFNGTDAILYVNGTEVARTALGSATTNTNSLPITIGADSDPVNPREHIFDGTIDEVAIYDHVLAPARIQAHVTAANATSVDPSNGGIVGTVSYDTTRNELDAQFAFVEDWQPGISGLTVNLYQPVTCGTTAAPCDATGRYELDADGAYTKGHLLNTYVTETWERPTGCVARDVNGDPLTYPNRQQVLPNYPDAPCLEGPLMGVQFQSGFSNVDGNYGFGDGCFAGTVDATDPANPVCIGGDFETLPGGRDYLVEVEIPNDATGRPLYKVTREEDINIGNGDQFVPQVPPPICAGPLHTVDVADSGTDGYPENTTFIPGVTIPASTPTVNTTFLDIDGSIFEGVPKPLCDTKLVPLNNGRSIVPLFNLFTDVPLPGRFWGLLVDDLNFSANPQSLGYGEKAGVPFAPVGIYDWTNRLVLTAESDYNGIFEVLLPSSNRINCPTPSGVCANLYRFVGNDPGVPGQLNPNYKPEFRTIAAEFEAIPGLIVPADLAPTQVGVSVAVPGGQVQAVSCAVASTTPQLFTVSQPYVNGSGSFTINGLGFGTSGTVTLGGTALPTTAWSDTQIAVTVPAGTPPGPHQLAVTASNGQQTINGLTFHVLGSAVGPFPSTTLLDNFNRFNNGNIGNTWSENSPGGGNGFSINNNQLLIDNGQNNNNNIGTAWWSAGSPFGADQEAYFTFAQVSPNTNANEQGVLLKFSGSGSNPESTNAQWIEVALNNNPANTLRIRTKTGGSGTITTRATFTSVTFAATDQLGARALSDGTIIAYKNGVEIGRTTYAPTATWTGRVGVRFEGTGNNSNNSSADARIDNFGGGDITGVGYTPNLYEVGPLVANPAYRPPLTFDEPNQAIQNAIDDAAASPGDDLIVVYPGQPDLSNLRANPRGAYYANLIISSPVKLQGVGPGGFQGATYVPGSIIDGGAFGGDGLVADNWYTTLAALTWDGNQTIYDGAGISIFAQDGVFTSDYQASIDGFDVRGGNQQGFPGNINLVGGLPTGLPPNLVTQGGAVFANGYARYLQISNNTIQNNGGAYGTVRIGTPDLPAPDTSSHNENVRIVNNRIILNAGTNLAGGIGLFAGADNYEVAHNDLCGNFSAEYGGGLTVYGLSPNGSIHDNRIYFNRSYDEGGGVMIAGELPAVPGTLSPGSGPTDIYNNVIQTNMANDDGGGIRFLMAGNFPMNVYNNMIVNNVSTHEGGGIGINDAPDVRVYNNTIMKNQTTATAITSNGLPAPAGLSTSQNSAPLQATLPGSSPIFSNPVLFNNIFWDNRAGTLNLGQGMVTGLGAPGDVGPINYWDLGVADGTGVLAPTNSVIQQIAGVHTYTTDPSNSAADPVVVTPYDISVDFQGWRTNLNFIGAILVALDLPPSLLGNYHIPATSPVVNLGVASKGSVSAPTFDIDGDGRPSDGGYEAGADELMGAAEPPPPTGVTFPSTGLLDNFNTGSGLLSASWSGSVAGNQIRVSNNSAQARGAGGDIWWNPTSFGANQEAYMTLVAIGTSTATTSRWQGMLLKLNGTDPNNTNASGIDVRYRTTTGVTIRTKVVGGSWIDQATFPVTINNGDVLGARAEQNGLVSVYLNGVLVGSVNVTQGANPWPTALAQSGGWIGASYNFNGGRFDNFSGGNMP